MPWAEALIALAVISVTALAAFFASAHLVRDFYGGSTLEAFRRQLLLLIGWTRGFQIIEDGRVAFPRDSHQLLGPLQMIIKPGNGVILERGKHQRVFGASVFRTGNFEYVKTVFDLREHQRSVQLDEVLSRDLIPVNTKATITYTLNISDGGRQGTAELLESEQDLLRQLAFKMPDWETATRSAVEHSIRQVVNGSTLNELLSPGHIAPLERRIQALTNGRTLAWGVRVDHVLIECVQPSAPVKEATITRWVAGAEGESTLLAERARALAAKEMLQVIAQGYALAKGMGMTNDEIHREILRRTLEQIARDPATKYLFTPELRTLLDT